MGILCQLVWVLCQFSQQCLNWQQEQGNSALWQGWWIWRFWGLKARVPISSCFVQTVSQILSFATEKLALLIAIWNFAMSAVLTPWWQFLGRYSNSLLGWPRFMKVGQMSLDCHNLHIWMPCCLRNWAVCKKIPHCLISENGVMAATDWQRQKPQILSRGLLALCLPSQKMLFVLLRWLRFSWLRGF